jgi:AcrR family transcriptional regulator
MAPATDPGRPQAAGRVTKRRLRTRQRLLDAASAVFADEGFGRSTVEQICERAGYTRGAFYSNFDSLEELFLAMWEQRSAQVLADITTAAAASAPPDTEVTLGEATERILAAIPIDDRWYRITAEFSAHAMRNPELKKAMVAREDAIVGAIMPILADGMARIGLRITDRGALGRALVAVHDGTSVQVLMEPDNEDVKRTRVQLFLCVLENHSERAES